MATPSSPTVSDRESPTPNHQPTATMGGASSRPTPANNAGGGSGMGDKGFMKGNRGGHVSAQTPQQTIYSFLSLKSQKGEGERYLDRRYRETNGGTTMGPPTCETEDHSFMEHTPGCPSTLPGWGKLKHAGEM
ncbi:hypothetical protein MPDQ_000125 [Monascus purpureus]|uniref:Uncharacterized protein n=1 Tax=Monascus purpureus TaxID=5098 RepID=A0A507R6U4_MONPU|nr:hypothetical protein MPDQ_000125 [Monascus purpureus]BDD56697.1 hypothetical protein MAP00_002126 [Monascus purpureus]